MGKTSASDLFKNWLNTENLTDIFTDNVDVDIEYHLEKGCCDPCDYVSGGMLWGDTPEGETFWNFQDSKWRDYYMSKVADMKEAQSEKGSIASTEFDAVARPKHYNHGNIEVIEAIEDWGLEYHLGNVVKYVARANHKGKKLEDLKKAKWYLERVINKQDK